VWDTEHAARSQIIVSMNDDTGSLTRCVDSLSQCYISVHCTVVRSELFGARCDASQHFAVLRNSCSRLKCHFFLDGARGGVGSSELIATPQNHFTMVRSQSLKSFLVSISLPFIDGVAQTFDCVAMSDEPTSRRALEQTSIRLTTVHTPPHNTPPHSLTRQ
jgi:hypothetical protein